MSACWCKIRTWDRGSWALSVDSLQVSGHLTFAGPLDFLIFCKINPLTWNGFRGRINSPAVLRIPQMPWKEEMKGLQRQYSPLRTMENFHFSENAFYGRSVLLLNHCWNNQQSSRVSNVSSYSIQTSISAVKEVSWVCRALGLTSRLCPFEVPEIGFRGSSKAFSQ